MVKLPSSADLGRAAIRPPGALAVSGTAASQEVSGVANLQQVRSPNVRPLPAFENVSTPKVSPVIEARTTAERATGDGGLGQIATALGGFGEMLAREEDRIATIQADDAGNKLAALRLDKTLQAQQVKGDKVLKSFVEDNVKDFNAGADALGSSLSPKAQEKFLKVKEAQKLGFRADVVKYAVAETDAYEKQVNAVSLETKVNTAINARTDPVKYANALAETKEGILKDILASGVSQPDMIAEQMQLRVSKVHARVAEAFVAQGEIKSAAAFINAWKTDINPGDKAGVVAEIQRRQELGAAMDMAEEIGKQGSLSQQLARVEALRDSDGITAERAAKVSTLLEKKAAERKEAQTAYVTAVKNDIQAKYQADGNLNNVTDAEIKAVGPEFWNSAKALEASGMPKNTDWTAHAAIRGMLETPEGREEFMNENLRLRFSSRIALAEMIGLEKIQSSLRAAADKAAEEEARVQAAIDASDQQERMAIIEQVFRKGAGLGSEAKLTSDQAERFGVFFTETNNRIRNWAEENPRKMIPKDVVRGLAAKAEASQVIHDGGFWSIKKKVFPSEVVGAERGNLSVVVDGKEVDLADIPDADYKAISAELRKRRLPVDDTTVTRYWLRGKGNR